MAQLSRTEARITDPPYRWVVLAAGTAAQTGFSAVLVGLPVLGPAMQARYDLSLSAVGLAFSSVWIGPIATLLPWGLLADRIGERIVLASGLAGCGVIVAAAGWAGSFWLLIALLTIAGALGASVNAASGRAVMQWFSADQRGLALGVRQTAIPVGGAIAALALPAVNSAAGLKASFLFLGTVCIGCALFAGIAVREAAKPEAALDAEDVEWTLRDRRLWILSAGSDLYLVAQVALLSFFVLFLHDQHGLSDAAAAAGLGVMQVGAVVTRLSAGRISDALGARIRPLRWIGLASSAGVLLTAILTNAPVGVVLPVMVVAGAISMAWNGLSVTAAAELAGLARSGAAIGFQQTTLSVTGLIVPVAFASVVDSSSWEAGFALASLGPFLGWLLLGRLPES
ncbi:MAG TPA: MFS transporter [Gaiellaceae bacterium]|nr:MFS transporter [Gaiellaceae bacterium]